jgi:hypothetical protein
MYNIFWEDDDGHLYFHTDKHGTVWAHARIFNWSKHVYYKAKAVWLESLDALKEKGIEFVCVAIPDNDPKLEKFEKMFGFEEVENIKVPNVKIMYKMTGE